MNSIRMNGLVSCFALCAAIPAVAQEVVGAGGGHYATSQAQLSVSIGEPVTSTVTGAGIALTQGFEQPWADVSTAITSPTDAAIMVFPNPVRHELFVALGHAANGEHYHLLDASGKLVLQGRIEADRQPISMEEVASGTYHLLLNTPEGTPLAAFRIIVNH